MRGLLIWFGAIITLIYIVGGITYYIENKIN